MPRPEKVQAVEEIRQRLAESRATFVTEYRGLTVPEQQTLRAELRKAEGEYKIVKMSLARRAADEEGLEQLHDVLAGPTALAFATADAVTVAKALRDFAKEHEHLIIKAGVLSGEVLTPEKVSELADIQPREVLLGRIAGGFQAPMSKLAGLLQALPRNAASMFSQLLEKKETEPAPAEAEAEPVAETPEVAEEVKPEAEAEPVAEEAPEASEVAAEEAAEAEAEPEEVEAETPVEEATVPKVEEATKVAEAVDATPDAEETPVEETPKPKPKAKKKSEE